MLVSLDQAKEHLRVDTDDGDSEITFFVEVASQAVLNYIQDHSFLDSSGNPEYDSANMVVGVPRPVQQSVLILVAMFDRDRDGSDFINPKSRSDLLRTGNIILPRVVHFLLDPYRLPILC